MLGRELYNSEARRPHPRVYIEMFREDSNIAWIAAAHGCFGYGVYKNSSFEHGDHLCKPVWRDGKEFHKTVWNGDVGSDELKAWLLQNKEIVLECGGSLEAYERLTQ